MARRDERPKASDIFHDTNYLFGRKVSFEEAFPTIEDISVEVEETGHVDSYGGKRTYRKGYVGEYIDCHNRFCYNGGVQLGSMLREMIRNKATEHEAMEICQGYEGSPKGRRKYRKCLNFFRIKVSVKYKES